MASPLYRVSDGAGGGIDEYFMLKMRLSKGLCLGEFEEKFSIKLPQKFYSKVSSFEKAGLLKRTGDKIAFTPKGFLVSNSVISDLLFSMEFYD